MILNREKVEAHTPRHAQRHIISIANLQCLVHVSWVSKAMSFSHQGWVAQVYLREVRPWSGKNTLAVSCAVRLLILTASFVPMPNAPLSGRAYTESRSWRIAQMRIVTNSFVSVSAYFVASSTYSSISVLSSCYRLSFFSIIFIIFSS